MFEAKKIMNSAIIAITPDTPIYQAMKILIGAEVSAVPVVDDERNLVGILSEHDMMSLLVDQGLSDKNTVGDFMTTEVSHFSPDDSAVDICEFMLKHKLRRVPIVEDGKLVGDVSRCDIISLIIKLRGKAE